MRIYTLTVSQKPRGPQEGGAPEGPTRAQEALGEQSEHFHKYGFRKPPPPQVPRRT